MKEVVSELYESKLKYDKMYIDSNLPRETMEQHMYTYLNQKYGLKVFPSNFLIFIISKVFNNRMGNSNYQRHQEILKSQQRCSCFWKNPL